MEDRLKNFPPTTVMPGGMAQDVSALGAASGLLIKHWRTVTLAALVSASAFTGAAFLMPHVYRAEVVLAPQSRSAVDAAMGAVGGQLAGISSMLGLGLGAGSNLESNYALAVLESRKFTREFIESEALLPVLFSRDWDAERSDWKHNDRSKVPSIQEGITYFGKKVRSVSQDSTSGLVTLRIDWTDRLQAAYWANSLVKRLNEEVRQRTIADASRTVAYLRRAIEAADQVELRGSLSRLMETELKKQAFANVTEDFAFRVVDPAAAPDADDYVSPRKLLLALIGLVFGAFAGMLAALLMEQK